jgi:hypothetical protein
MWVAAAVMAFVAVSGVAEAQDVLLYELTESVRSTGRGGAFKSSDSTLAGWVHSGTAICPTAMGLEVCSVTVRARGRASDDTGIGPVTGTFQIVVQDANSVDGAELVVATGSLSGDLDLSPVFLRSTPLGTITGSYSMAGVKNTVLANHKARGWFTGTFRIPYVDDASGRVSYLMDDGRIVPVQPEETSLGVATVRLELRLQ